MAKQDTLQQRTIHGNYLKIYGNCMEIEDTSIQLSNVSHVTKFFPADPPFPFWSIIFFALGFISILLLAVRRFVSLPSLHLPYVYNLLPIRGLIYLLIGILIILVQNNKAFAKYPRLGKPHLPLRTFCAFPGAIIIALFSSSSLAWSLFYSVLTYLLFLTTGLILLFIGVLGFVKWNRECKKKAQTGYLNIFTNSGQSILLFFPDKDFLSRTLDVIKKIIAFPEKNKGLLINIKNCHFTEGASAIGTIQEKRN